MASPITPDSLLVGDAIGWHEGDRTLTYSFVTRVPNYYKPVDTDDDGKADSYLISPGDEGESDFTVSFGDSVAMGKVEAALTRQALREWAEVANLDLVEVAPGSAKGADITLGSYTFDNTDTFGFVTDFPDGSLNGIGSATLGKPSLHGDFWINTGNPDQVGAVYGNTGWQTYLHELGHAFGLHHPDDEGEPASPIPFHNNQYTVMSYVAHPGMKGVADAKQDWPITPMMYDIAAIQALYGANLETRAGTTSYFGTKGAYALKDGGLLANGRTAILTVWDAGGIDTIDASNQTGSVRIDLNPGAFSTIGKVANNIGLALAVKDDEGVIVNLIENARGGSAADVLIGNAGNNTLEGGAGADRMSGGAGNDTYAVDNSADLVFEKAGGGIDRILATTHYALKAGQEIESVRLLASTGATKLNLAGNEFGQTLVGNAGANVLEGKGGHDILAGGRGGDTFVFGSALGKTNIDHITDFAVEDTIRLDDAVFKALAPGWLKASEFKDIGKARVDADDHILYDSRSGSLFYDIDGSGKAAAVKFAVLDNKAAITHADFFVV